MVAFFAVCKTSIMIHLLFHSGFIFRLTGSFPEVIHLLHGFPGFFCTVALQFSTKIHTIST